MCVACLRDPLPVGSTDRQYSASDWIISCLNLTAGDLAEASARSGRPPEVFHKHVCRAEKARERDRAHVPAVLCHSCKRWRRGTVNVEVDGATKGYRRTCLPAVSDWSPLLQSQRDDKARLLKLPEMRVSVGGCAEWPERSCLEVSRSRFRGICWRRSCPSVLWCVGIFGDAKWCARARDGVSSCDSDSAPGPAADEFGEFYCQT